MLRLYSTTHITQSNMFGDVSLEIVPPKSFLHVHVHFGVTRMNRIRRVVCFLQNQFPQLRVLWNTNTFPMPQSTMFVFMEPFGFSSAYLFFNLFDFFINLLGFFDLVQQSGLNIQRHEMSFRHNLQSEFTKLGTQIIWQFSFGKAIHKNLTT